MPIFTQRTTGLFLWIVLLLLLFSANSALETVPKPQHNLQPTVYAVTGAEIKF